MVSLSNSPTLYFQFASLSSLTHFIDVIAFRIATAVVLEREIKKVNECADHEDQSKKAACDDFSHRIIFSFS